MDTVTNMIAQNPGTVAIILAVLIVIILVMIVWPMFMGEGMTAGGAQELQQGFFCGGRTEAFGSRTGLQRIGIPENMGNAPVSAQLQAEGRGALMQQLGCKLGAGGQYVPVAPDQPWGWLRDVAQEGATPEQTASKKLLVEGFGRKREGLDDASLTASMVGM